MSVATTLSRVTGFARIWATGLALGVGPIASAYYVANNIPNMIFELVAGGILSSLFIPTFLETDSREGEEEAWRFASHVFNVFVFALGIVALLGTLLPQPFIWTQTFRLGAEEAATARVPAEFFFRFFAIQVVFYGGSMVVQGLLNARRRYLWAALAPVFNNLVVIATALWFATQPLSRFSTATLAVGTTLGVVAMLVVMIPDLVKLRVRYTPSFGWGDPRLKRMLVLAGPTVIYVITNLVAVSFRNASAFASSPSGPATLQYAWTFYQLPYGILAVALATAVFTELSDSAGRGDIESFKGHYARGLTATALLILPTSALVVALAEPLASLYTVGRFTADAVPAVAAALRPWAAGLVFYACMMFTLRSFYALKDTRTPMITNLFTSAVHIAGYWVLTTGMLGWDGFGVVGVPIADGLFFALQFGVLIWLLGRKVGGLRLPGFASSVARMALVSVVAGAVAWGVAMLADPLADGAIGGLAQVLAGGAAGVAFAYLGARLIGVPELALAESALRRRLARRRSRG